MLRHVRVPLTVLISLMTLTLSAPSLSAQASWTQALSQICGSWLKKKSPAEKLFAAGRDQEAIWALARENPDLAEAHLEVLRRKMESGAKKHWRMLDDRAQFNEGRVILDNGASGIVKQANLRGSMVHMYYGHEVFAYELDRILGLNRVPLTIYRSFHGKPGSFQFWIKGAREFRRGVHDRSPLLKLNEGEWGFFGHLVNYTDEHEMNEIYTADGYRVFIDNSGILEPTVPGPISLNSVEYYAPRRSVYLRLKNWRETEIRQLFGKHGITDGKKIESFLQRRQELLDLLKNYSFPEE